MSIVNRRNAMLGWLTWQAGKRIAARKARSAIPSVEEGKPNKGLILSLLAAAGAVLFLWRRKGGDGGSQDAE
ncbi:MAG: hypothetical protein H0T20_07705 [Actinobacteria bacterium]|nr:hypothetical protein [Actinomycetota bacterium]